MKNVLLLGDSICLSYQSGVKGLLKGKADVYFPVENCRWAGYTLNSLTSWMQNLPKPDVIHWNNGLWDIAVRFKEDGCFTPLKDYKRDLERILRELRKTGAKIIFALNTPITSDCKIRVLEDVIKYNACAAEVMKEANIEINDLYSLLINDLRGNISDDGTHLTQKGVELCAAVVSETVIR